MSLNKQPFPLPINADKKETSLIDKLVIQSHNEDGTQPIEFDMVINKKQHTKSVKIKFFVTGYRILAQGTITYIGKWVELEPHQLEYFYPLAPVPSASNGVLYSYFLGFYPYSHEDTNDLHIRLKLYPFPNNETPAEIYIEKVSIIDSDFDSELSWLTDESIPPFNPTVEGLIEPPQPIVDRPNPNNAWIF